MIKKRQPFQVCFGTISNKWVSFGICNTLANVHIFMTPIFSECLVNNIKVFMDDFQYLGRAMMTVQHVEQNS